MKVTMLLKLFGFMALTASFANATELSISLPSEGKVLTYPTPVRLEQVLNDTVLHSNVAPLQGFSLNNQLFNLDKEASAVDSRNEVLTELNQFKNKNEFQASIDILIEQIKRWDIGYREQVSLDFDEVRISPQLNPQLSGNYELLVINRSETISLEGLFFSPQQMAFDESKTASDYIKQALTLSSANESFVWIIYPDGHYVQTGYSYWNDEKTHLTPGTVLFLGFNTKDNELISLEEKIVKLIVMRKGM